MYELLLNEPPSWGQAGLPPGDGDELAALVESSSGVDLACSLAGLPDLDLVDGYSLVEVVAGWEKVARFARAQMLRAVAELAARRGVPGVAGSAAATEAEVDDDPRAPQVAVFAATEVSLALGVSYGAAAGLLMDAAALTTRLPAVLGALEAGRVHEASAHVIADETAVLDAAAAARVAEAILARPGVRTVPQVKRAVRAAVARVDPATAEARVARAVKGRFLRPVKDIRDDMVSWQGWLPTADSVAIWDRLCELAAATRSPGDARGVDARRADVAADLLLGRPVLAPDGRDLNADAAPYAKVWRTDVIVEATTVGGADEHPGMIPGWGPVTAATARLLASGLSGDDGEWRRMLTDPASGLVKDYGTHRYRPPTALADYVRARDGRCYEPLCLCSAWRGDLDHVVNSPAGPSPRPDPTGRTAADNLGAGCRRGHTTKAAPGWRVVCPREGTFIWTTPSGHEYTREPEPPLDWHATTDLDPPGGSSPERPPPAPTDTDPPF